MAATVLRLKLRILGHTLRSEGWRVVVMILGGLWALSALPSVIGGMVWLSGQSVEVSHDVLVVAGTVLVIGWAVVPVLIPGMDDSLEITRFATFGVPVRRLVPGLLLASLLGVPTVFAAVVCLAPAIAWGRSGAGPWEGGAALAVAVAAAPLALATCVLAARLSTGLAARLLGTRRSKEVGALLGLLVVGLAVPGVVAIGAVGVEGALERVPAVAQVLGWTPLGLVWAAPAAMAAGDVAGALTRVALAAAWVAVGIVGWSALLRAALVRPPSRGGQVRRRRDGMLPARRRGGAAAGGPIGAIRRRPGVGAAAAVTRRSLRYWSADPRYSSALLGAVVAPVVIVLLVATVVDAPAAVALSMGPLMAGTIGWGRHNDVAFDGSAFWMHVSARVPGWADRLGRAAATLVWAAPVTVAVGLVGVAVADRRDLALAALGASLGVLCAGLAVSAVFSTLLPYPVPEPGANPYAAQMGAVGASLLAQVVTSAATIVLCLPVLGLYAASMWWGPAATLPTFLVGVVGGVGVLVTGIVLGGRVYDARASRILARLA
ncbi:hypothetical protein [Cellulomonas sp. KRMCY2]|uniref:hypothetical protein n=1 Tax=Cellulomonas sp. KRMCY2 TaxID=1304865 RepID=UPI00045E9F16|nr:hypothetical protein [Cellulomonas sp. KRMCY2]